MTPVGSPSASPPAEGSDHHLDRGHSAAHHVHAGSPHDKSHAGGHDHDHPGGLKGLIAKIVSPHSHDSSDAVAAALSATDEGVRALEVSLVVLAVTAVTQLAVVLVSGSVALLSDTIHNFADAG